ncbi:hypothetical protein Sgou_31270 [Streptomyces gougerotii]|uniref:Uncharacterized protein n=1 Tax=Streptomyces gougerotii TaxID=53448 RepID=A0A8H9HP39_9ACTN|nr:hypothetical protein Sgou_31270 [Streptomyces gougerotii]GGU71081.1 hypothetical protein GCM10010227_26500 [Streptomyces gougerotii]
MDGVSVPRSAHRSATPLKGPPETATAWQAPRSGARAPDPCGHRPAPRARRQPQSCRLASLTGPAAPSLVRSRRPSSSSRFRALCTSETSSGRREPVRPSPSSAVSVWTRKGASWARVRRS